MNSKLSLTVVIAGLLSTSLHARAQEDTLLIQDAIIVEGNRANPMLANVEPEVVLDVAEIRSYGAESLQDLLADLSTLTSSSRGGAPAILLNGRRISGLREIRNYPPEALASVEVLPETVALKFGFRADQKVINFILRDRFHALTASTRLGGATDGGQTLGEGRLSNLRIRNDSRWNIDLEVEHQDALFESDRDIIRLDGDLGADRSLQPEQSTAGLTGSYSHFLPGDISATYTLGLDASEQQRTIAQSGTSDTLDRDTDSWGVDASFVLNKTYDDWNWSVNGRLASDQTESTTQPDLLSGLADRTDATRDEASLEAVGFFKLATLPAGDLVTTLKAGAETEELSTESERDGSLTRTDLSRDSLNAQINLDAPLLDRDMANNPLGFVSLNANARVDDVSDVGGLSTYGMGLTWHPLDSVQIIASGSRSEDAPSLAALGNPISAIDNARIFDFATGETVDGVELISGGNPDLSPETRNIRDLNVSWDPFEDHDISLNLTYTETDIENAILDFPGVTPQIELAFPDRISRDANNDLFLVDARSINIAESNRRELRYGFNWSIQLPRPERPDLDPEERSQLREIIFQRLDEEDRARIEQRIAEREARRAAGGDRPPRNARGQGGGRAGGGGGRGGRGGPRGSGRLFASVNHTLVLEDSLLIATGGQRLDLLGGDAISDQGGTAKHQVTGQVGASRGPLGGFLRVRWQSETEFDDGAGGALQFDDLVTTNLRLQYNFGNNPKLLLKYPFLDSTRVALSVDNLFDQKQRVTNSTGLVPINYQADLLDPRGRSVMIRFRKLFY